MRYKELKEKIEEWGQKYNLSTKMTIGYYFGVVIKVYYDYKYETIAKIDGIKRYSLDLDFFHYINLSEEARKELFDILVEFAATDPADREDLKEFIIPLPDLVTSNGSQQYLTHKGCNFFACGRNPDLRQTWKEEHLKFVPEVYRQFAVEFDEDEEF